MLAWTRRLPGPFLLLGGLALALAAGAQEPRAPRVDVQKLMHHFMLGRFSMPVTCTQADGSLLEREEAVVFRSAHDKAGFPMLRATFFGIDAPEAVRCYNVVQARLTDRRGSLFVTFPAIFRPDLGMRDFRRILKRGPIEFRVVSGHLQVREIGAEPDAAPGHVRFDDSAGELVISTINPLSDGDKLLAPHAQTPPTANSGLQRFGLLVNGPEEFQLRGYYQRDAGRRR